MVERVLITGALLALLVALLVLGRRWYAARNERIERRVRAATSRPAGGIESGSASDAPVVAQEAPRIVYFTTRTCVVCRAQQEPAMEALRRQVPDVRIDRHDAVVERQLADDFGVLSVPTTAVYDRNGQLVTINRGFAPAAVLYAQIEGREPAFEAGAEMASEPVSTPVAR